MESGGSLWMGSGFASSCGRVAFLELESFDLNDADLNGGLLDELEPG